MEPEEREIAARFLPRSSYNLVNEDLRYIDVQYLSLMDALSDADGPWSLGQHVWTAVVDEDFVDAYPIGSLVRLHATVHVDHLPERTFDKDTRRVMILRVEGIDLLDEHATHFDEVTWTSEPSWR